LRKRAERLHHPALRSALCDFICGSKWFYEFNQVKGEVKMTILQRIDGFLKGVVFAVVGASQDRAKYGNKVLRCYLQHGLKVYPVNPKEAEIEGQPCFADLASLPEPVHGISIITPPHVTEAIVPQAAGAGIQHLWMQPGAESAKTIETGRELGLSVIGDGSCLLVVLGYREEG
jgi:predicted CoA-binding protein